MTQIGSLVPILSAVRTVGVGVSASATLSKEKEGCQSLSLVYRRWGWFKNFLVNSNGGTFPMLVWSLS